MKFYIPADSYYFFNGGKPAGSVKTRCMHDNSANNIGNPPQKLGFPFHQILINDKKKREGEGKGNT